jgi:ATP-grasp domain
MTFVVQSKIMIAATTWWPMPARLAAEFVCLGAQVGAICPADSPLAIVDNVHEVFTYSALAPCRSLAAALRAMQPDLIIPCDDRALSHLHELHAATQRGAKADDVVRRLIERSLGDPALYPVTRGRAGSMALAAREGILEPATKALRTEADVAVWCGKRSFPALLKADGSWGGNGVVQVDSPEAARIAFRNISGPPATSGVLQSLLSHRDPYPLRAWLNRERSAVVGQDQVKGRDANIMVACWEGEVLATVGAIAVETTKAFGATTIVQPVVNAEMEAAARILVRVLGISGFCGFDFIIEDGTGKAYMIELNPRATQLGHLPLAQTGTLAAALLARSRGEPLPATAAPRIAPELVAFFPQAWISGVNSPRLRSAYQDIPWDQPKLMAHLLRRLGDGRGTLTRVIDRLTGRREARFLAEFHQQTNGLDQTSGLPFRPSLSRHEAPPNAVKARRPCP